MSDHDTPEVRLTEAERKLRHMFPADGFTHNWYREDAVVTILATRLAEVQAERDGWAEAARAQRLRAEAAERQLVDLRAKVAGLADDPAAQSWDDVLLTYVRTDALRALLDGSTDDPDTTGGESDG